MIGIDLELSYSAKHASGFLCSALVYLLKQEKESKHNPKTENSENILVSEECQRVRTSSCGKLNSISLSGACKALPWTKSKPSFHSKGLIDSSFKKSADAFEDLV